MASRKIMPDVRAKAQPFANMAIEALVEVIRNSDSNAVRVSAANAILDRAYGKPRQDVGVTGEVKQFTRIEVRLVGPETAGG